MALIINSDTGAAIAGASGSFNYTVPSGSNRSMFLYLQYQSDKTVTLFTYAGVQATLITSLGAGLGRTNALYQIINPTEGLNAVALTLNANPTYNSFVWVISFANSMGLRPGQYAIQSPVTDPALLSYTSAVLNTSCVLAGCFGNGYTAAEDLEIPTGTADTNLDSRVLTGLGDIQIGRNTNAVSGLIQVKATAPLSNPLISLWTVEIGEYIAPPPSRRRCLV